MLINKKVAQDSALALVLIQLIFAYFYAEHQNLLVLTAGVSLLLTMINPMIFKFWAYVWMKFAHLLGTVNSHILLTLIFLVIIAPIGLLLRAFGKDTMGRKRWMKSTDSAFTHRDYKYNALDLKEPF